MKHQFKFSISARGTFVGVTLGLSLFGCSSVVKQSWVRESKTGAILSLSANRWIRSAQQTSASPNEVDLLQALRHTISSDPVEFSQRQKLAQYALWTYTQALTKALSWKMISTEELLLATDYQNLAHETDRLYQKKDKIDRPAFSQVTPPKMFALPKEAIHERNPEVLSALSALCQSLKLDAIAIIDLDLAYDERPLPSGGYGKAIASVQSSLTLYHSKGQKLIEFPYPSLSSSDRSRSTLSFQRTFPHIQMKDDIQRAFEEAIDLDAAQVITKISRDLK